MTARVLVVDDMPANRILLEATLANEYYDVVSVEDGETALARMDEQAPDIVLLDVMMPGLDGFEVCRRIKAKPDLQHIPVILITALDDPSSRVEGLEAGADDFLTKPVDNLALLARVKNLVRIKTMIDELRQRFSASGAGLSIDQDVTFDAPLSNARALVVDDDPGTSGLVRTTLETIATADVESAPENVVVAAQDIDYDLAIVSLGLRQADGLRLCSQLRSTAKTRHLPILVLVDKADTAGLARALDMGVNDCLILPIDRNELRARVRSQIRHKRYFESLREAIDRSLEMAMTDTMTGLHNRRYLEHQLPRVLSEAAKADRSTAVLVLDLDRFKSVNDQYGHAAGDEVLRQFARHLANSIRGVDMAFRLGGEEFVVIMPNTGMEVAERIAERIRARVAGNPCPIPAPPGAIPVTVSIGVSVHTGPPVAAETLIAQADEALYTAKRDGRNRVVAAAA